MLRPLILLALVSIACLSPWAAVEAGVDHRGPVERRIVAVDGRLRSAFLLRATGIDKLEPVANAREKQLRLRRHFDAVLDLLVRNTEQSLDIAARRLEVHRGEQWSEGERARRRQELAEARLVNLYRLHRYQQRGRFPINEHAADRAVPVFVDNYDTACAVGHLMRESGWGDEVAAIQAENNLVYVTDVTDGPVAAWVATSGLTQEEAAIIQPAYEPPLFQGNLAQLTLGGSVMTDDLRYENFRIGRGDTENDARFSYILGPLAPDPGDLSQIGVGVGDYVHFSVSNGTEMHTVHDEWVFIGATGFFDGMASAPGAGDQQWIIMSYDVIATKPGHFLTAASLQSIANFNFNRVGGVGGSISIDTLVMPYGMDALTPAQLAVAAYHLGVPDPFVFFEGADGSSLPPRDKYSIASIFKVQGPEAQLTSFIHSFEVVPEPGGLMLGSLLISALVVSRRFRCVEVI